MPVTAKDTVRRMLDEIPDDATYEDIEYRIYVRRKVEQGLKDLEEGRTSSHEEVERRMARWLED